MNIELKKVNGKDYKVVNGTFYTSNTNNEIIEVLEDARKNGARIRIFYGNTITGEDWLEDNDTIGTISRTFGDVKSPILLKRKNSTGGRLIFTEYIVKITINKRIYYIHDKYHINFDKLTSDYEKKNIEFFKGNTNKKIN